MPEVLDPEKFRYPPNVCECWHHRYLHKKKTEESDRGCELCPCKKLKLPPKSKVIQDWGKRRPE